MKILLANPRGFCAGVDRAIEIVERALELFGAPIYVRHEVVHNRYVVDDLREQGRGVRRGTRRGARRRNRHLQRPRRVPGGARGGRRARACGCSTPPARWSPRCTWRSAATAAGGREVRADRPPRATRRSRAPWVSTQRRAAAIYLVESPRTMCSSSRCSDPDEPGLRHPDHAVHGRHRADHRRPASALSRASAGRARDDICYATQNRQDAVKALARQLRPGAGGRLAQQLQLQPPARNRRKAGHDRPT